MQHTLSDYHLSQITLKPLTLVSEDVVSQTSSYCQAERSQSFPPVPVAHLLPLPRLGDPLSVTSSYLNSRKPPNMENGCIQTLWKAPSPLKPWPCKQEGRAVQREERSWEERPCPSRDELLHQFMVSHEINP